MSPPLPLRPLLVTRRFWPLVGGAETAMANLAAAFHDAGHAPRIITAQWERAWPTDLVHREVPVHRLPNPSVRLWGTFRYMRSLRQWLEKHRAEYDLVYVSMLKHDAYAALRLLGGTNVPVVLRAEGSGASGDVAWQRSANFGRRIRSVCQRASALVAPSRAIAEELRGAGYAPERIHEIPNGVEIPEPRSEAARRAARETLADANPGLTLSEETHLAVYTGRLTETKGLRELVDAWPQVLTRFPAARLWLVGEGPMQRDLMAQIGHLGWPHRIFLPGAFDDVSEILAAADLFVFPSWEEGMSLALLEAMASGLAIVASDIPGNRALIEQGVQGVLVPVRAPASLASHIISLFESPARRTALGAAARQRVEAEFSLTRCVQRHVELFAALRTTK